MSPLVKNIVRFVLLTLAQAFVFDNITVNNLFTPYVYILFIILLPSNLKTGYLLVLGFLSGAAIDAFTHNAGFCAAAATLTAFCRPAIFNLFVEKKDGKIPFQQLSITGAGSFASYFAIIISLSFLHNAWLMILQMFQFGNVGHFLLKILLSTIVSTLLIIAIDVLFSGGRKKKKRTSYS